MQGSQRTQKRTFAGPEAADVVDGLVKLRLI